LKVTEDNRVVDGRRPWPETFHRNDPKREENAFIVSQSGKIYAAPWQNIADYSEWILEAARNGTLSKRFDFSIFEYNVKANVDYPIVPAHDRAAGIVTLERVVNPDTGEVEIEVHPIYMGPDEASKAFKKSYIDLLNQIAKQEKGERKAFTLEVLSLLQEKHHPYREQIVLGFW
jgi:hypothetical protein